jgi:hypothetical protein
LKSKIVQSLKETVASPVDAILPTFLTVKPSSRTAPVSEHEKQFLELKHEVDLLRNEVVRRAQPLDRPSIQPDEAEERIRAYLRRGMARQPIIARLSDLGAPTDWVRDKIREYAMSENGKPDGGVDVPV